jgi:hypothetical protein
LDRWTAAYPLRERKAGCSRSHLRADRSVSEASRHCAEKTQGRGGHAADQGGMGRTQLAAAWHSRNGADPEGMPPVGLPVRAQALRGRGADADRSQIIQPALAAGGENFQPRSRKPSSRPRWPCRMASSTRTTRAGLNGSWQRGRSNGSASSPRNPRAAQHHMPLVDTVRSHRHAPAPWTD